MKLDGILYNVTSHTGDGISKCHYVTTLNQHCDIYRGHFPGNPVTPGVVMMAIARELLCAETGYKLTLAGAPSVKYTALLSPVEYPTVSWDITWSRNDADKLSAKITLHADATTFARMSLSFIIS